MHSMQPKNAHVWWNLTLSCDIPYRPVMSVSVDCWCCCWWRRGRERWMMSNNRCDKDTTNNKCRNEDLKTKATTTLSLTSVLPLLTVSFSRLWSQNVPFTLVSLRHSRLIRLMTMRFIFQKFCKTKECSFLLRQCSQFTLFMFNRLQPSLNMLSTRVVDLCYVPNAPHLISSSHLWRKANTL